MLVLTRRIGERVMIGNDIEVSILGIQGNQVKLGINAPREVEIHREEIFNKIRQNRQTSKD